MKNFHDVYALCGVLKKFNETEPGQAGQASFVKGLMAYFEFTDEQANLYASIVLSRNAESSADAIATNAGKVTGTWARASTSGIPGGWFSGSQESWRFSESLTYEHKRESLDSYSTPFGANFSRPRSSSEQGIWAPSDSEHNGKLDVVVISLSGFARRLQLFWTDSAMPANPRSCTIAGETFARQY